MPGTITKLPALLLSVFDLGSLLTTSPPFPGFFFFPSGSRTSPLLSYCVFLHISQDPSGWTLPQPQTPTCQNRFPVSSSAQRGCCCPDRQGKGTKPFSLPSDVAMGRAGFG